MSKSQSRILLCLSLALLVMWGCKEKTPPAFYDKMQLAELPLEARYQGNGPEESVVIEFPVDSAAGTKIVVTYPSSLVSSDNMFPLVVVCNGSNTNADLFLPMMRHLSSWGFVVADNMDEQTARGNSIVAILKEILILADTEGNPLYGKIDPERIGIAGYSQGAVSAMMVSTQSDVSELIKAIYLCSCPQPEIGKNLQWGEYDMADVRVPILMFLGTGWAENNVICPFEIFQQNFDRIPDGIPAVQARRTNKVDHDRMGAEGDAYMTAWFRYVLDSDKEAEKAFFGPDAEILRNGDRWQDVRIKTYGLEK